MEQRFWRYPIAGSPADSTYFVDTTSVMCDALDRGDSSNCGEFTDWIRNGDYYIKGYQCEHLVK